MPLRFSGETGSDDQFAHEQASSSTSQSSRSHASRDHQMSDVTTRADDRWARLTLLLWSQREEEWREQVKSGQDGRYDRTFDVLATYLSTTGGGESICQVGKLLEMPAKTHDGEEGLLEGGEDPTRGSSGEGIARREEQKNTAFRSAPRRPRP